MELPSGVAAGRLFVYGTLMPGESRWPALRPYVGCWRVGTAQGRMWDTGRGYPAVRFDRPGQPAAGGNVPGVVADLLSGCVAEAVERLDRIEDEGVLYRRVEVTTSHGPAMAYEWLGGTDGMARLATGWPTTAVSSER